MARGPSVGRGHGSATTGLTQPHVLVAMARWLVGERWKLLTLSPCPWPDARAPVEAALAKAGLDLDGVKFEQHGPDIVAQQNTIVWRIECIGGGGSDTTRDTYFARGFTSVACDRSDEPDLRRGLSAPDLDRYRARFRAVPEGLRAFLRLWFFLVRGAEVHPYPPGAPLPAPSQFGALRSVLDQLTEEGEE